MSIDDKFHDERHIEVLHDRSTTNTQHHVDIHHFVDETTGRLHLMTIVQI
jgi:hypothetical protein